MASACHTTSQIRAAVRRRPTGHWPTHPQRAEISADTLGQVALAALAALDSDPGSDEIAVALRADGTVRCGQPGRGLPGVTQTSATRERLDEQARALAGPLGHAFRVYGAAHDPASAAWRAVHVYQAGALTISLSALASPDAAAERHLTGMTVELPAQAR